MSKTTTVWEESWGKGRLLKPEKKTMCCLGFDCRDRGAELSQLLDSEGYSICFPSQTGGWEGAWAEVVRPPAIKEVADILLDAALPYATAARSLQRLAAHINDSDYPLPKKKKALRLIFAAAGRRLIFKKGTAPYLRDWTPPLPSASEE